MILQGNNVILASETSGISFAGARSCELNVQCDTIETSTPGSGEYKTFLPGRKSWSMSLSHLVMAITPHAMAVGQSISVTLGIRGADTVMAGTAIVESWKVTATRGNLVQGSFKLRGSGALTLVNT